MSVYTSLFVSLCFSACVSLYSLVSLILLNRVAWLVLLFEYSLCNNGKRFGLSVRVKISTRVLLLKLATNTNSDTNNFITWCYYCFYISNVIGSIIVYPNVDLKDIWMHVTADMIHVHMILFLSMIWLVIVLMMILIVLPILIWSVSIASFDDENTMLILLLRWLLLLLTYSPTSTPFATIWCYYYVQIPSIAIINTDTYYTGCYYYYWSYSIRSFVVDVFDREGFTFASLTFWFWDKQFIRWCY